MVDQYSCPAVASDLHDFPHWTFRFHSFPSNSTSGAGLDFTNKDYLETLAMWTGIPLVVAGVVLVTSLVVMCCVCGNQSSEYDRIRKPRSRKCLSFLSILILLSAGAVIGLNVFLNKNVSSTQDDIKSVKSNYDGAIAAGNDLADYLRLSANFVNDISTRTQGQCQTDTRDMSNRLDNVAAQVSSVVAAAPVLSLDDVEYDTLSEVNRDRSIFTYAFEAVLVVLSLFLVSGCCGTRSKVMAGMLVGLVFLMVLLVYLFFGVQLSAMAGAGDFCYDPIAFGVAQLDNVQNADYYLVCSADSTFPYEDDFNQAEAALLAAQQALAELDAACNTTVSQADLDRINGMPLQSSAMLAALKVQVSCPPTHNLIVHGLNTMCSDGLKRVVVMEGCVSLQLLALSICLFLSIFLYQTTASQRRGLYEFDDESAPLLTPSFDSKPAYRSSSSSTNNGATTQVSSCRRCNKRLIAVVLLPCRHTLCRDCSLQCFTCPWCQATIQERQAIMYSPN